MGIYNALLGLWIRIGESFLPPTVHPMLVHFPIVCLYLALGVQVWGLLLGGPDRTCDQVSFWLTAAGLVSGVAAAAAGVISEQFVKWTPTTSALLAAHQRDAFLTGFLVILVLVVRLATRYRQGDRRGAGLTALSSAWSFAGTGRGRSSVASLVLLAAAVASITVTASIGGTMVYQYGVGIHGVTFRLPPGVR